MRIQSSIAFVSVHLCINQLMTVSQVVDVISTTPAKYWAAFFRTRAA